MRRFAITVGVLWGFASIGFTIAIGIGAPEPQLAGRLYASATAAAALALLTRKLATWAGDEAVPGFEELLSPPADDDEEAPSPIAFIEQSVRFSCTTAGDLHSRLRPLIREIAGHRLTRRNVRLDSAGHQERAEAMLGPELFELVRKNRPLPRDRFGPGMPQEQIEQAVAVLQGLE